MSPAEASRGQHGNRRRSVSCNARLPPSRDAGAAARRLVRTHLGHILSPSTLDDVLLVVSELVTNAVRHGRGEVDLQIGFEGGRVTGHVSDEGDGFAAGRVDARPADRVGHHGLRIVEQLTDDWGIQAGSAHVWFAIESEQVPVAAP